MDEEKNYVVRRLTPDECALLQGYPIDWCNIGDWTDTKGKIHKDSDTAKYKAYGNSIALPQWQWIIDRMADYLPKDAKVGSLFDGIGGFPLCWERTHGKGSARWASEIEEFPIAVTKKHFPENNSGENAKFGMSVEENIQPLIVAKGAGGVCGTNGGSPACNQGGMAVVQGADMYNGSLTGDIAATLNAASGVSAAHSGPSVVQGFDAYNQAITGDVAMPLRNKAADSDHIPVVCLDDK